MPDPPGGRAKMPPRLFVILILRGFSYATTIAGATMLLILGYPLPVVVAFATAVALGSARAARHLTAGLTPARPKIESVGRGRPGLVQVVLLSLFARTRIVSIGVPGNSLLFRPAK
ncbi:hypothetical protein ACFCV3_41610 [Kribbella sp. NPDC056345]|uniref:hypothetical protein n=1 Tax=Kribbella sp. NPDC056345 TaxID=3345789 RepID=UPI0035DFD0EF